MSIPDTAQSPARKSRSRTLNTHIPISIDEVGCPELPTTTMSDGYRAKIIQSMLREYCTTHIRELSFNPSPRISNLCQLGFVTGMAKQVIPWGALVKDPSSWISEECFPTGFEWKDPSKIQVGEIFRLLDHWRDRQDKGVNPLIWLPTCPLFQDAEDPVTHGQTLQKARVQQEHDSDEEVFILPSSEESDQEEDESNDNKSFEEDPPASASDSFHDGESIDSDGDSPPMHISHPIERSSCEHCVCFV
jgi:hypothetical protein